MPAAADTLQGVVGLSGENRRDDVLQVHKVLNQIPVEKGGQAGGAGRGLLRETGMCLYDTEKHRYSEANLLFDATILAICKFQMQQFKCCSGQINPDSVTWAT